MMIVMFSWFSWANILAQCIAYWAYSLFEGCTKVMPFQLFGRQALKNQIFGLFVSETFMMLVKCGILWEMKSRTMLLRNIQLRILVLN
jgi:hypothetical protein